MEVRHWGPQDCSPAAARACSGPCPLQAERAVLGGLGSPRRRSWPPSPLMAPGPPVSMLHARPLSGRKHRREENAQICTAKATPVFNIEIGGHGGPKYNSVDLCAWWAFFHANGSTSSMLSGWPCCL